MITGITEATIDDKKFHSQCRQIWKKNSPKIREQVLEISTICDNWKLLHDDYIPTGTVNSSTKISNSGSVSIFNRKFNSRGDGLLTTEHWRISSCSGGRSRLSNGGLPLVLVCKIWGADSPDRLRRGPASVKTIYQEPPVFVAVKINLLI